MYTLQSILNWNPDLFNGINVNLLNILLDMSENIPPVNQDTLISNIILRCGLLQPVYGEPNLLQDQIKLWWESNYYNFFFMWRGMHLQYNPIENYDRYENSQHKLEYDHNSTDSGTDTEKNSGTDTEKNSGIDTEQNSGVDTEHNSGNDITQNTGTDTTSNSGSDTSIDSQSDTTSEQVSAFNANSYQPKKETTTQYGKQNTLKHGLQTDITYGGKSTLTHGLQKDYKHGLQKDYKYGLQKDLTYGMQKDFIHGKSNKYEGHDMDTYAAHAHGNIGVTTNQKMLTQELLLRQKNVYEFIADSFESNICITVY